MEKYDKRGVAIEGIVDILQWVVVLGLAVVGTWLLVRKLTG